MHAPASPYPLSFLCCSKNESQRPKMLWKGDELCGGNGMGGMGLPGMGSGDHSAAAAAAFAAASGRMGPGGLGGPRPHMPPGVLQMMQHLKAPSAGPGQLTLPPGARPALPMPSPAVYAAAMASLTRNGLAGMPPAILSLPGMAVPPSGLRPPMSAAGKGPLAAGRGSPVIKQVSGPPPLPGAVATSSVPLPGAPVRPPAVVPVLFKGPAAPPVPLLASLVPASASQPARQPVPAVSPAANGVLGTKPL